MSPEDIEAVAQKVYELLRMDVFRLPPRAAQYLAPFHGYMPPPIAVGYGPDYCMLYTFILDNGGLVVELKAPDGEQLLRWAMMP